MGKTKVNEDGGREAVKLRMEVVKRVRKNKEKTGVPINVFFERAAGEKFELNVGDNCDAFRQWLCDNGIEYFSNGSFTTLLNVSDPFSLGVRFGEYRQAVKSNGK